MKQPDDNIGTVKDLALHRIETAKSDINSAKILLDAGEYRSSNNREYVKTEVFPRNIGRRVSEAAEIRHASDYDDFYIATKIEAEEQIATAEELLNLVQKYCNERLNG